VLSQESINEFKEIYQKEFAIKLSETEAIEKASQLIRLYKIVLSQPDVTASK
jgi:hypothetical protein